MDGVRLRGWRGIAVIVGAVVAGALAAAGQWQGGIGGAALIAIGGVTAPEVSDWLRDKWAVRAGKARTVRTARIALDRVSEPAELRPSDQTYGGAAFWLRPEQRVVGFINRPELARLQEWCSRPTSSAVMLVTGPGGVGKTRLGLRLAEEMSQEGWLCRVVRPGRETDVIAAARMVTRGPVLLILDYAETRGRLSGLLAAIVADHGNRLRVLLIARGAGEWWARLAASADTAVRLVVTEAERLTVGPLSDKVEVDAELVRAAVPAFARVMGARIPDQVEVTVPAGPVPVLVLHAAALLAVIDAQAGSYASPVQVVADEEGLGGLLNRERMFWLASATTAGLYGVGGMDSVTAAQTVAVACLLSVPDETEAAHALRRVPSLGDAPEGQLRQIARWLRQLYPADLPSHPGAALRWWGAVQPDLLAERHVVSELADAPDLADGCLRSLTPGQARGALTMLARACRHHTKAPVLLTRALRTDLVNLGVPAIQVAVQTGGKLGAVLADVLATTNVTITTLIQIEEAVPNSTVALAEVHAILVAKISQLLPEDTPAHEFAHWRYTLGVSLAQAGQVFRALPAAREAVFAYRELSNADPHRFDPDLAASLGSLGACLIELGRPAEALPLVQEAVEIRRVLAGASRYRFDPDLAASLDRLGACLIKLGRPTEALPLTKETVAAYRLLTDESPDRYRPRLAASLDKLGACLSEISQPDNALLATQEAVSIYRELAAIIPDRFNVHLASSLQYLSERLAYLGDDAMAGAAKDEALAIESMLVQNRSART